VTRSCQHRPARGSAAHRYITGRAIDLLPPLLKPFFDAHCDEIVLRSTDLDLWRNAGREDDPNSRKGRRTDGGVLWMALRSRAMRELSVRRWGDVSTASLRPP